MQMLTEFFHKKDNLLFISAGITMMIMALLFLVAQMLGFTALVDEETLKDTQMEVREIVKLKFTRPIKTPPPLKFSRQPSLQHRQKTYQPEPTPQRTADSRPAARIANLLNGFDKDQFLSSRTGAARRGTVHRANRNHAGINTNVERDLSTVSEFDIVSGVTSTNAPGLVARRSGGGGLNTTQVGIGGASSFGNGLGGSDLNGAGFGADLCGRGTSRTSRGGTGNGAGAARISIPSGSGGGESALDLHALIKWMKAHPGIIPKLVAYDMGHRSGDLSSAVIFQMNGKNYQLFLSCNETEMLLRICLVEGNEFTLLKDNGIKEVSNFLITGNVVRERGQIRSLISSRRAPAGKANVFYQIFWSWWLSQQ